MPSQIRRSGSTSSDLLVQAPSKSSARPAANPASPAKAALPTGQLSALSPLSKTTNDKTDNQSSRQIKDTTTKWDGLIIRTRPGDSKAFARQVGDALNEIASKPAGAQLLQEIGAHQGNDSFGYKVAITPQASEKRQTLFRRPRTYTGGNVTKSGSDAKASTPGEGASSAIKWNPQQAVTPDGKRPPFIGLAHELIHAHNNLKGESSLISKSSRPDGVAQGTTSAPVNPKIEDENKVVGLGQYADAAAYPMTENTIRQEHGLPRRERYSGLDD